MHIRPISQVAFLICLCIPMSWSGCDDEDTGVDMLPAVSLEGNWKMIIPGIEHRLGEYTVYGDLTVYDCTAGSDRRALLETDARFEWGAFTDYTFRIEGECERHIQWQYYTREVPWEIGRFVGTIVADVNNSMDTISGVIDWYDDPYTRDFTPCRKYLFTAWKE